MSANMQSHQPKPFNTKGIESALAQIAKLAGIPKQESQKEIRRTVENWSKKHGRK